MPARLGDCLSLLPVVSGSSRWRSGWWLVVALGSFVIVMSIVLVLRAGGLVDLVSRKGLVVLVGPSPAPACDAADCLINAISDGLSHNRPQNGATDVGHEACQWR